jgi:general secretion pathway protein C
MDVRRKRGFWIVNVVVVGVCAGFAGRAAAHFVESASLVGGAEQAAPGRHRPLPLEPSARAKDGEAILRRNIFCSGCAPTKPAPDPRPIGSTAPQPTSLQLELISTMIVRSDERFSMAIIRDLSTKQKDTGLFNKGAIIGATGAEVLEVRPKQVFLRNGDRIEYLSLDGAAAVAQPGPAVAHEVARPPRFDPNLGDLDQSVHCGGSSCTVERALVEKLLANTTMLVTAARFVPSIKDGRPNGFKLFAIRPDGIFGKLQFHNDDTIKAINGSDMTTVDAALALFTKLRNASHLSVQLERRGESMTLDYTIR